MASPAYRLDDQIGFLLRRAHQRHTALFGKLMPEGLTPTQFAAMARLSETGPLSQNLLGRKIAVDGATIKGVVDRLSARELVSLASDPTDGRLRLVALTAEGRRVAERCIAAAAAISAATLDPIADREYDTILRLLAALADPDDDADDAGEGEALQAD
jgi:DNA-binding MarR family transcriptional regulator